MRFLAYVAIGALFGAGLVLAEMTKPERIIGFLDFFGDFDPSLLFVMMGAVLVHGVTYRLVLRRPSPLWSPSFSDPPLSKIDARLVVGSALFGIGWGIGGYCPGPALASVLTLTAPAVVFVLAMIASMIAFARSPFRSTAPRGGTAPSSVNDA